MVLEYEFKKSGPRRGNIKKVLYLRFLENRKEFDTSPVTFDILFIKYIVKGFEVKCFE